MANNLVLEQPPIRCFVSYAHGDDAILGIAEEFKRSLESFAHAACGRRLEVFLDRTSIGWGEDWPEKIREGVTGAMAFMPLLTCRYFERTACREELLTFFHGADELSATDLLLPVVLLGKEHITTDSDDTVIRIVAKRQFRDLEAAVIAGPGTPEWRSTMLGLAKDLVAAVERIEAQFEPSPDTPTEPTASLTCGDTEVSDDAPGLLELDESLGEKLQDIHGGFQEVTELLAQLNTVFVDSGARMQATKSPKGPNNPEILRFARKVKPLAERFESVGTQMERTASEADSEFRQLCELLSGPGTESQRDELVSMVSGVVEFQNVLDAIDEFLPMFRPLEITSAGLRRSVKPMRRGTNSIRTAVAIITGWPGLLGGPGSAAA